MGGQRFSKGPHGPKNSWQVCFVRIALCKNFSKTNIARSIFQSCLYSLSSLKCLSWYFHFWLGCRALALVIWQCLESFYKSCFLATRTHWHHCGESEKSRVWYTTVPPVPQNHNKYKACSLRIKELSQISNSMKSTLLFRQDGGTGLLNGILQKCQNNTAKLGWDFQL